MYKHLLIATDGSDVSQKAVDQGLDLAKAMGARVTLLKVTEMWSALDIATKNDTLGMVEKFEEQQAAAAKETLTKAQSGAETAGVQCTTKHIADSVPADGILKAAKDEGCDLIVMGSHGRRGISRILLGSQAVNVPHPCGITGACLPLSLVWRSFVGA